MISSTHHRPIDPRAAGNPALRMVVIYNGPADYPGKFVARLWELSTRPPRHEPEWVPTQRRVLGETLEEVRKFAMAPGRLCFPRQPDDDACIVECWW